MHCQCLSLLYFFWPQKPKSTTAAKATLDINPDLQVEAHLNKVCPATESIYSDSFYSRMNVVVTALDNVEARRYIDRLVQIWKSCRIFLSIELFLSPFVVICFPVTDSIIICCLPMMWQCRRYFYAIFIDMNKLCCVCLLVFFSRCLSNQKPLLDSGTMGTKGHTEIIVPNLTESYNSHVSIHVYFLHCSVTERCVS